MIELSDFQRWTETLTKNSKLSPDRSAALANNLLQVWETFFLPADTNRDGSVELPELQAYMKSVCLEFNYDLI